jgi:ferredoxin
MVHRIKIGDGFAVDVTAGASLLEICEEHDAPVPFDCRGGACGTCLVRVVAGAENLSALTDNEVIMLEELGSTSGDMRLACQLRVLGPVELRLEERA